MSRLDDALREAILGLVPELVALVREEIGRPKLVPLKDAPVPYRRILTAARDGELHVYRVGHASFVDEAELYAWIRRIGSNDAETESGPEPDDEIGRLIELQDRRRAR